MLMNVEGFCADTEATLATHTARAVSGGNKQRPSREPSLRHKTSGRVRSGRVPRLAHLFIGDEMPRTFASRLLSELSGSCLPVLTWHLSTSPRARTCSGSMHEAIAIMRSCGNSSTSRKG